MNDGDGDLRPSKRQKLEHPTTRPLPADVLLLSLPQLLQHPPTHRHHTRSLFLSLFAMRKYLSLPGLDSILECRASTELAEIGFRIGLGEPGIANEVEKSITKSLMILQKHPSLRIYKPQLTRLSARLATEQRNHKLAQNLLKKTLTNFITPSDPPHVHYAAHLAYITSLDAGESGPTNISLRALGAIRDLHALATRNSHSDVALFALVLELRDLVANGVWNRVGESLLNVERELKLAAEFDTAKTLTNLEKVLIVHVLIIGVLYYTYTGDYANCQPRIKKLHDMLDGAALDAFGPSGIIDIHLPNSPPLTVQVTHPRVIFTLGFLVSSVSKRDPVGRKPKRKLFAQEGVLIVDKELKKEFQLPLWASVADVRALQDRMHKMKADLMCELIGVAISRSEFDDAEQQLAQLIAHTRTHGLFSIYSARITLHHAHLSHALTRTDRALKCYQVAAYLSRRRTRDEENDDGCEDRWVNVSARAGELWLRVGLANELADEDAREREMEVLRRGGMEVVNECEGLGGTLQAVGAVLGACLSTEFLVAKTRLRTALNLCTTSLDNHLRPLVLALIAAQYVHTSTEHAESMLGTAEQLAAGLGAQPKVASTALSNSTKDSPKLKAKTSTDGVGNAHLRLWIGERALELKRRSADEQGASKQVVVNDRLRDAVGRVQKRKFGEVE
ncbi:hypothetical protein M413DRAFT_447988 [Hebeloma cylindrosporum]|uniref:Uncharacterized protein n=1 Tax=Hebeloma cylindrosporum TaxID=76867 RepID=A0A0C2XKG4_HEBCY|nr:hypothetical protein M413DRAFT_447988 [Hebeloma cylindrosporum h7]